MRKDPLSVSVERDARPWSPCSGRFRIALPLAEIYSALKPGGILAIVEVIFDPHFQTRSTVTGQAIAAGLRERAFFGHSLAYVMHFEKPGND